MTVERRTADLVSVSAFGLVVYLGMRINALFWLNTLFGLGPQIGDSVAAGPNGLQRHKTCCFHPFGPAPDAAVLARLGIARGWRPLRAASQMVVALCEGSGRHGFWRETYFMRGGMESIYDATTKEVGTLNFAPAKPVGAPLFSARTRTARGGPRRSLRSPTTSCTAAD